MRTGGKEPKLGCLPLGRRRQGFEDTFPLGSVSQQCSSFVYIDLSLAATLPSSIVIDTDT